MHVVLESLLVSSYCSYCLLSLIFLCLATKLPLQGHLQMCTAAVTQAAVCKGAFSTVSYKDAGNITPLCDIRCIFLVHLEFLAPMTLKEVVNCVPGVEAEADIYDDGNISRHPHQRHV
jgi:hypothetical protein